MKCSRCSAELAEGTKFCSYCGQEIEYKKAVEVEAVPDQASASSKITDKATVFWNKQSVFGKVLTIAIAFFALLCLVALLAGKTIAVVFSLIQIVIVVVALLIHKGTIRSPQVWLKYVVFAVAVLLTALNVMSYSWSGSNGKPSGSTAVNPADTSVASPYAAMDCIGLDYKSLKGKFNAAGFQNVSFESIEDLSSAEIEYVGTVESVSIGGETSFTQGQEFEDSDKVLIRYHALEKFSVSIYVDFVENLLFSKYDVKFFMTGEDKGTLDHGEDKEFSFNLEPGEYTLIFESTESSSVKGEVVLTVDGDLEASYKISCYNDKVSVDTLYVNSLTELAEGEVKLDVAAADYKKMNYEEVTTALKTLGFTNIQYNVLYDIVIGWTDDGEVESVSIDGNTDFKRGDVFTDGAEIVITYHLPKSDDPSNITMAEGSSSYDGMNYLEVEQMFKDIGFTNIELDMVTTESTSHTDGEVMLVEIDGGSFDAGNTYTPESKVYIKYYSVVIPEPAEPLFYSTNDYETAKKGNTGVFSYKHSGKIYDIYWIIDFDEGYVYYFTHGDGETFAERVKIESGDLNSSLTITYHDSGIEWSYGFHFSNVNEPETLIMQDQDGFENEYSATDLTDALNIRDGKTITDY